MKLPSPGASPKIRRHLSADALHALLRGAFEAIPDHRPRPMIPLADALMSAFAMFSLKDPSLLAFDGRPESNLRTLYRIGRVPCDTQMREILDPVDPEQLRPAFNDVFRQVQRGKVLERMVFHDDHYLVSIDGTGYFSSPTIHCESCLEKHNRKTGEITYAHQMLGAAIVHPDLREVIPLAPEPIIKQDGTSKNDCERNAVKRLLRKLRREHPHMKFIVIEDALASNAPHIRDLTALDMRFLLGVKPGDHAFLFDQLIAAHEDGRTTELTGKTLDGGGYEVSFVHDLPLNESNQDLRVNVLQYTEWDPDGNIRRLFTWVTDLTITRRNALHLVRGGRARWKIENETFNTLKNQGYHFEHNYGHGKMNLSVVFAMLMMLAFLVDQVQQLCCPLFRAAWQKCGSKRNLWETLRSHFHHFVFDSMRQMHEVILHDLATGLPAPVPDTS